jgi:hypothetical protein
VHGLSTRPWWPDAPLRDGLSAARASRRTVERQATRSTTTSPGTRRDGTRRPDDAVQRLHADLFALANSYLMVCDGTDAARAGARRLRVAYEAPGEARPRTGHAGPGRPRRSGQGDAAWKRV